ncbi:hypothetical protein BYT27DRAFT_7205011 [Phlegmacium glaucopus]|nr:hypothetical protein BYT27DRAFT_7205011 [Phlegmacium glaucopus]
MSITIRSQARCLDFPQELSAHVFEFETLRNDASSLKHCSLVCRAWLHAARTHLFRQVILTPNNIDPFTILIIDSRSTVIPHVRKLELRRIDCSNSRLLANFASTLTHLHLRDKAFRTFIDILDIICSFPYLQSVALDELTVETSSVTKSTCIQNKALPSSVNSVRCRGGCLRTFLLWLLHHDNIPKLSNLDVGPIGEENIFEIGKYLAYVGPAMKHLSFSFDFSHNTHICGLQVFETQPLPTASYAKTRAPSSLSIAERYKALFGLDVCPNLASLTGLQSLRLDDFIHFEDHMQGGALVWGPRIIASSSAAAAELREVVLGVSVRQAGEVDKFNIRWEFLDETFTNMDGPYANLVSLKFQITGTVNLDGITSLIRSRLPGCEERGLLQFFRENYY